MSPSRITLLSSRRIMCRRPCRPGRMKPRSRQMSFLESHQLESFRQISPSQYSLNNSQHSNPMLLEISEFIGTHKAAFGVASAWLVREAHVVWPYLVQSYPYASQNGGVFGVIKRYFFGLSSPKAKSSAVESPTSSSAQTE